MALNIKPIRNYPFRGKIYTAKQIDEILNGAVLSDYYTKDETDTAIETAISDYYTKEETDTAIDSAISAIPNAKFLTRSEFENDGLTAFYNDGKFVKNCIFMFKFYAQTGRIMHFTVIGFKDNYIKDCPKFLYETNVDGESSIVYRNKFINFSLQSISGYNTTNHTLQTSIRESASEIYNGDNDEISIYMEHTENTINFICVDTFSETSSYEFKVGVY